MSAKPVFRTESRTAERFVGLPSLEKAKLWPTIDAILSAARATHEAISDQLVLGALKSVLIEQIVTGRFEAVYVALGKVLGVDSAAGKSGEGESDDFLVGKSLPAREVMHAARRPLARATR